MTDQSTGDAPAVAQLAKLLGMLGSSFDGEVLVAARKAHALVIANDWTWPQLLANGSSSALTEEQMNKIYAAGIQRGEALGYQRGMADAQAIAPQPKGASITVDDDVGWISKVLEAAAKAEADQKLDTFEIDFSASMRAKVTRFGRSTYVSQKQFDSLKRLEKSLRRRGYL
jgi:hypothetical protein